MLRRQGRTSGRTALLSRPAKGPGEADGSGEPSYGTNPLTGVVGHVANLSHEGGTRQSRGLFGVLVVVACGLYLSRKSAEFFSPNVHIQIYSVWSSLTFILNGVVFVLIGLQLPFVLAGIKDLPVRMLLLDAALFSGLVIALRLLWVFPGARLAYFIRRRLLGQNESVPPASCMTM